MKCAWCDTESALEYRAIDDPVCVLCVRCVLFHERGPAAKDDDECPPVPGDANRQVIDIQLQCDEPMTPSEYFAWVQQQGNDPEGDVKAYLQTQLVSFKIRGFIGAHQYQMITEDGGKLICFDYDLMLRCACLFPPTTMAREELWTDDLARLESMGESPAKIIIEFAREAFPSWASSKQLPISMDSKVCVTCQKIGPFTKVCPRCGEMFYCSHGCQKKHWKLHKKGCLGPIA